MKTILVLDSGGEVILFFRALISPCQDQRELVPVLDLVPFFIFPMSRLSLLRIDEVVLDGDPLGERQSKQRGIACRNHGSNDSPFFLSEDRGRAAND
jgi:hypothetical protein